MADQRDNPLRSRSIGRRRLLAGVAATSGLAVFQRPGTVAAGASDPDSPPPISANAVVGNRPVVIDGLFHAGGLYVGLYGLPGLPALGALGEEDASVAAARAQLIAAAYDEFAPEGFARPAFEIIASVASASPGPDGTYSARQSLGLFQPYIDAATAAGVHLVFDLQPGRASFVDQARAFEDLWRLPNVSIALDPEWRVRPDQRPGRGLIGSVDASEINATIAYIDDVITRHGLPPKMCLIHQFRPVMISNQSTVTGTANVSVVFQMDGFGTLDEKRSTWAAMVALLPPGAMVGWKNFFKTDRPLPSPAETMANTPAPTFVSYQ